MNVKKQKSALITADTILNKRRKVNDSRGIKIVFTIIFAVYTALLFIPFIWILINSFRDKNSFNTLNTNTWSFPIPFAADNYATVFQLGGILPKYDIPRMFLFSIIMCLLTPTISILTTVLASYAMAKYNFRLKKFIYVLLMIPMFISITGTQSALIKLFHDAGWYDMPFIGIAFMSACGTGMNFLLLLATFKSVSNSYMEAARIDGAGELRIFGEIMLPHAAGVMGTLWVLGVIGTWNDYGTTRLFLAPKKIYTIAYGLQNIQEAVEHTTGDPFLRGNFPILYAAIIISLIPVLVVFFVFQKQIMKLSLGGGIK